MLMGSLMFGWTLYSVMRMDLDRQATEKKLRHVFLPFCFVGALAMASSMWLHSTLSGGAIYFGLFAFGTCWLLRYPLAYLFSWYCLSLRWMEKAITNLKARLLRRNQTDF